MSVIMKWNDRKPVKRKEEGGIKKRPPPRCMRLLVPGWSRVQPIRQILPFQTRPVQPSEGLSSLASCHLPIILSTICRYRPSIVADHIMGHNAIIAYTARNIVANDYT